MKRLILIMIISMFLISLVGAEIQSLPTGKQGDNITLLQIVSNATSCNLSSVRFPNSTLAVANVTMVKDGTEYTYNFGETDPLGTYTVNGVCGNATHQNSFSYTFDITYSGEDLTVGGAVMNMGLLALCIFILVVTLGAIPLLPNKDKPDENGEILHVSSLKHLRIVFWGLAYVEIMAIFYLASNVAFAFLNNSLFGKFFFMFFQIMFALLPVVTLVFMIYIFVKAFQDVAMKRLIARGETMFAGVKSP